MFAWSGSWNVGLACDPNPCAYLTGVVAAGCRYLRVTPNTTTAPGTVMALKVTRTGLSCPTKYVAPDSGIGRLIDFPVYLTATQWGLILVADTETVSGAGYQVQTKTANVESAAVSTTLRQWGDVVAPYGIVNFSDISATVECFKNLPSAPPRSACDLYPALPDQSVDFLDVSSCVEAFKGKPYPFTPTGQCP